MDLLELIALQLVLIVQVMLVLLQALDVLAHYVDLTFKVILLLDYGVFTLDAHFKLPSFLFLELDFGVVLLEDVVEVLEILFSVFGSLLHEVVDSHLQHLNHLLECHVLFLESGDFLTTKSQS